LPASRLLGLIAKDEVIGVARCGSPGGPLGAPADNPDSMGDVDQDTGDVPMGVDEDALDSDDLDTDRVTSVEALEAAMRVKSMLLQAEALRCHV
jgi:hypothetical protein